MGLIKYIIIWLFIFIVGSLIVSAMINPNTFSPLKNSINNIKSIGKFSIEDFNKNQELYVGKEVKIYGQFVSRGCIHLDCNILIDKKGNEIAVLTKRHLQFNEWYTFEGEIIYDNSFIDIKYYLKEK